ncbi:MAG: hypothetical protein AB1696_27010 [Planctomycetota bacterium]
MSERRGRERIFEIDPVKRPKSLFLRRVIAKYVGWVQVFGYFFCAAVAFGIVFCWMYKVDEVANEKEIGKSLIKPCELSLTHDKEAVVTRVAVAEWQQVAKGAPVVEVCDDPEWVRKFKAIQQLADFAKQLRELEKEGALPPALAKQAAEAEAEVDRWNRNEGPKAPHAALVAPIAGEVAGLQDLVGKAFAKEKPICRIVDFNTLRLDVKLGGTNVERVRVGMPVTVEVVPQYGPGCTVYADVRVGGFRSERLCFNYILNLDETKKLLCEWWKQQSVATKEDVRRKISLTPASVEEVEVACVLQTEMQGKTETDPATGQAPASDDRVEVDLVGVQNPFKGILAEGKHTGGYRTNELPDPIKTELRAQLGKLLKGKLAQVPGDEGQRSVRIEDVRKIHNFIKIKAEVSDISLKDALMTTDGAPVGKDEIVTAAAAEEIVASEKWKRLREEKNESFAKAVESAIDADKDKTERNVDGVVLVTNPSPILIAKVKQGYKEATPAYLKAKVSVVVGRCRLAMLLFRSE